jgi:hypothetical protein
MLALNIFGATHFDMLSSFKYQMMCILITAAH